jgi:tetratricopeptide (TPR) repeat protein
MAWIEYDQQATTGTDSVPQVSREHRVLVKRDGQWKILSQITENVTSFGTTATAVEAQLNTAGYNLLGTKKANDAVEVFKLNVKLFPNSWNVYDSLGEAYAAAGDTKLAIENYEKSLALNPKNETGKEALAKLKGNKTQ